MPLLILIALAIGVFYLLVLPIIVFVTMGRVSTLEQEITELKSKVQTLREHSHAESVKYAAGTTPPAPAAAFKSISTPVPAPAPMAVPARPAISLAEKPADESIVEKPVRRDTLLSAKIPLVIPPVIPLVSAVPPMVQPEVPATDPNLEIRLGALWATRLGIALQVVTAVFFGVYESLHAQPWVRLLEVLVLAASVTFSGRWIERKTPLFGQVLFSGGLAIFYFAAYAAHAIPAMKVVESVALGLALQFCAVAAVTAVAWSRNRSSIASMAIFLGSLSCAFALDAGEIRITLVAALGLAVVGSCLRVARGWVWPQAFGYVGGQLCFVAAVLAATGRPLNLIGLLTNSSPGHFNGLLWPGFTLAYSLGYFVLVVAADIWAQALGRAGARSIREATVRCAALAVGLGGWWGGMSVDNGLINGGWASCNLLVASVACLVAGVVYWRRKDLPVLAETLVAAAGAWLAVYSINEYAGWIRWMAVLLEAFVFAGWVRRRGTVITWLCLIGTWVLSGVLAVMDADHRFAGVAGGVEPWSVLRLIFLGWPALSIALWTWVEHSRRDFSADESNLIKFGGVGTAVGTLVLGLLAWTPETQSWLFLALAVIAVGLAGFAAARTAWLTAGLSLFAALWTYAPQAGLTQSQIALALTLLTTAVIIGTFFLQRRAVAALGQTATTFFEAAFYLSLLRAWWVGFDAPIFPENILPLALTLAALGLAVLAWWRGPWRTLGDISWVWAIAGLGARQWMIHLAIPMPTAWVCLAAAVALAWLWGDLGRRESPSIIFLRLDNMGRWLPAILLTGWTWFTVSGEWADAATRGLALAVASLLFCAVARRSWLPCGGVAAGLTGFIAWFIAVGLVPHTVGDCLFQAVITAVILVLGWRAAWLMHEVDAGARDMITGIIAVAALTALDLPANNLPPELARQWLTILWALGGAIVFAVGLGGRLRIYRYVGLIGLALCLPRLFVVDITDTLMRIFAFGALAMVLLAIGFSYDKLRPWLTARDNPHPAPPSADRAAKQ